MSAIKNNIKDFILQIVNKDYKQANNALQNIVADKLKVRIKTALESKK